MAPIAAGILSTGTEILQGHYADTNAQWLSEKLTTLGIPVIRHVAASDEAPHIAAALRYLASECDLIIMTGGLGPTEDDLTRQAIGNVFGCELTEDAKAWKMIQERFFLRKITPPPSNRVQALIPKGATVFYNKWGTAPGFSLEYKSPDRKKPLFFAALPGPPPENRPMFEEYLENVLAEKFGEGFITRITNLHTFGVSESALNERLRPIFAKNTPERILALLASNAKVDIRFTIRARDKNTLTKETKSFSKEILKRVPRGCVYGRDAETLEEVVFNLLRQAGKRIAFAESCTGGYIAKRITDIPGSSEVFLESWVNYTNEAKRKRLGVRATTLSRYGAVSQETAREMAVGALERSDADIALAVTGIAGPGGGTPEKPVGLVWYGLAWKSESGHDAPHVETFKTITPFGRDLTRQFAAHRALDMVRRHLMGLPLEL